jgi:hypothetical protein
MATLKALLPYLEQGYHAIDPYRTGPAYVRPFKQGDTTLFLWTAYNMESEWAGPDIWRKDQIMKWNSDGWGIQYDEEESADTPELIEQVIREGRAYRDKAFEDTP